MPFYGSPPFQPVHIPFVSMQHFLLTHTNKTVPIIISMLLALIHKQFDLPNTLHENWHISSLLKGIKQCKSDSAQQKHSITVSILRDIHAKLNLTCSVDASFWAICLVAFFGLFSKSHLLIKGKSSFDASKQFVETDFLFFYMGCYC